MLCSHALAFQARERERKPPAHQSQMPGSTEPEFTLSSPSSYSSAVFKGMENRKPGPFNVESSSLSGHRKGVRFGGQEEGLEQWQQCRHFLEGRWDDSLW